LGSSNEIANRAKKALETDSFPLVRRSEIPKVVLHFVCQTKSFPENKFSCSRELPLAAFLSLAFAIVAAIIFQGDSARACAGGRRENILLSCERFFTPKQMKNSSLALMSFYESGPEYIMTLAPRSGCVIKESVRPGLNITPKQEISKITHNEEN